MTTRCTCRKEAAIALLGERQTEDLKVPGSLPGHGMFSMETGDITAIRRLLEGGNRGATRGLGQYTLCHGTRSLSHRSE